MVRARLLHAYDLQPSQVSAGTLLYGVFRLSSAASAVGGTGAGTGAGAVESEMAVSEQFLKNNNCVACSNSNDIFTHTHTHCHKIYGCCIATACTPLTKYVMPCCLSDYMYVLLTAHCIYYMCLMLLLLPDSPPLKVPAVAASVCGETVQLHLQSV